MQNLYAENDKALLGETTENLKSALYLIYGLEDSNIVQTTIFPILIYRFNTIPFKFLQGTFMKNDKLI